MEYDLHDFKYWIVRKEWRDVLRNGVFTRKDVDGFFAACKRLDLDPRSTARRMDVYDLQPVEERITQSTRISDYVTAASFDISALRQAVASVRFDPPQYITNDTQAMRELRSQITF